MTPSEQAAFYRIWGNVNRPERGCWTWRGKSRGVNGGYHQVNVGYHPETGHNILKIASRFVYEGMYGEQLPRSMVVTQLCGNRDCIKPGHLVGTTRPRLHQMKDSKRRLKVVR